MDSVCPGPNTPQFPPAIAATGRKFVKFAKSPKADNLLITKGKLLGFSLPKAENILKISQLPNCKVSDSAWRTALPAASLLG